MSENVVNQNPRRRRVMSGIRVTGPLHFGNYFGALKNWVHLQQEYDCVFGIMDWHGMTTAYKNAKEISQWTRIIYAEILSWGIDDSKSHVFLQSLVPEHLELYFIYSSLTPMGWLERVPTWKDAEEEAKQNDTHNLGRFAYPVLQAADIAVYKGELIPVGADQVAHIELNREVIRRFNHLYKGKWPEPKPLLTETPSFPGLDGRKMSKSYNNGIDLSEDEKSLAKKVKGMPTDPQRVKREDVGSPDKCNVFNYHKLFSTEADREWVQQGCTTAGIGCGDCKGRLLQRMEELMSGPRAKRAELLAKPKELDERLIESSKRCQQIARNNMKEILEYMKIDLNRFKS